MEPAGTPVVRATCVRVCVATKALPITNQYAALQHDDWPNVHQILDQALRLPQKPKVVFLSVSVSAICVSLDGWSAFRDKYILPLNVRLLLLVRQEWPETGTTFFFPLLPRMKLAILNLGRVLTAGVAHTAEELEYLGWLREEMGRRVGWLNEVDMARVIGRSNGRNMKDLLL